MKLNFTPDEKEFIDFLKSSLPPVIARKQVSNILGGIIAHQTLANADSRGTGPEVAYRIGRSVVYKTEALLHWLVKNQGVSRIAHIKDYLSNSGSL